MSGKVVKTVVTDADRKKRFKGIVGALCALLAVIIIVGVVLGLVSNPGFSTFSGYEMVVITNSESKSQTILSDEIVIELDETQIEFNKLFSEGLKSSKYSILRSIFEGNMGKNMKFSTYETTELNDEDEEETVTKRVMIKRGDIENQVSATENGYAITFSYKRGNGENPERSVKVEGETIYFDKATVLVTASEDNIIQDYTVYFYDSARLVPTVANETYEITPVIIKSSALSLKAKIDEIFEKLA